MNAERHTQIREALAAEALDALDREEHSRVREHLDECEVCSRELAELRSTVAALRTALPPAALDDERVARVRGRLLARVRAQPAAAVAPAAPAPRPNQPRRTASAPGVPVWSGWAAAAVLAGLLVTHHAFHQTLDFGWLAAGVLATVTVLTVFYAQVQRGRALSVSSGSAAAPTALIAPARALSPWFAMAVLAGLFVAAGSYAVLTQQRLSRTEARLASMESERAREGAALAAWQRYTAGLTGESVRVIQLGRAADVEPTGKMFWDRAADRWTFFAYDLPPVEADRTYQLWLLTAAGPVSAGTFMPGAGGVSTLQAEYALEPDQLDGVAVTEEPAGGVPQPTTTPILVGQVST
jgi:hypothetical protein